MTIVVVALVALVLLHGRSAGAGAGAGGTAATLPDPHAPIPGTGGAPAALSALGTLEKIDVAACNVAGQQSHIPGTRQLCQYGNPFALARDAFGAARATIKAAPLVPGAVAGAAGAVLGAFGIGGGGGQACPAGTNLIAGVQGLEYLVTHPGQSACVPVAPAGASPTPAAAARKVVSIALPDGSSPFQGLPPNGQVTTKPPTTAVWR